MYKLLLILKYLRRKLAPLFAALAVTLCTAMVIIVISVMGGFLETMRETARKGTGDITIEAGWTGFPHYEALAAELEKLPQVDAAAPMIVSAGIAKLGESVKPVPVILGVDPHQLDRVLPYSETLYWGEEHLELTHVREASMRWELAHPALRVYASPEREQHGLVAGIELYSKRRDERGQYPVQQSLMGLPLQLTVVPVTQAGAMLEPAVREFLIVNEVKTGLYDVDRSHVFVPFALLQDMMGMGPDAVFDPQTGEPTGEMFPGRTSRILVRMSAGYSLAQAHDAVDALVQSFVARHPDMAGLYTYTWEDQHAPLLNAVQNEKGLITFLFAFISMVAVVMIATTFYMIVLEKTRDIGVLRAIGASRLGIANIFLGYGLIIGLIGAAAGLTLGVNVVYNLNAIQEGLYQFTLWWTGGEYGWRMWNPETYYFDEIPERVDFYEAAFIAFGAVISSLAGAVIPAALAARLDPVESLRYE